MRERFLKGWQRLSFAIPSASTAAYGSSAVLVMLLLVGAGVRLAGMHDNFVSFNSTRQYHGALIARGIYYRWTSQPSDPRRQVAELARERHGELEPPILETLVALGYVLTGGEHLSIVRVLGTLFWVTGGALLYALGSLLFSRAAALVAAGYFLLVPFGVIASQSFQPDTMMLMLMIASCLAIVHHDRLRSRTGIWSMGVASGLAVLVKPVCAPMIVLLYAVLALYRRRAALLRSAEPWLMALLTVAPSALYYLPRIHGAGRLGGQADASIKTELWHAESYWLGWRDILLYVASNHYVLGVAALGVVLAPGVRARLALLALWLGYMAYRLTFTYHISTHNYYQLPALPILALSLAGLVQRVLSWTRRRFTCSVRLALAAAAIWIGRMDVREIRETVWPRTQGAATGDPVYEEIGRLVSHSTRVIFLTPNASGGPLEFYAELAGWYWPCQADLRRWRRRGQTPFDWRAEFDEFVRQGAEYFVSTPVDELQGQTKFARLLAERYQLVSQTADHVIYDLRRPAQ